MRHISTANLYRVARELAWFSFFLLLTIVLLWPHILHLDTAVSDRGDPLHITWILDWVCYALTHSPLHVFDAPMFHPYRYPLAYSENFIGIGIVVLPFYLIGLPPLVVYNIAVILGYALAGYGASVLARQFTSNVPAVMIAGIVFAFSPYKIDHLAHLHIIFSGWVPLLFAAFIAYRREPSTARAVLLCGAYVMNGLTALHWFLYGSVMIAVTMFLWLIHGGVSRDRRFWLRLFGALAVGGVILVPILIPYRIVSAEYKMKRYKSEATFYSATWRDWLVPGHNSALYTPLRDEESVKPERTLFPGLMPLLLTAAAIVLTRRRENERPVLPAKPRDLRALDIAIVIAGVVSVIGAMAKRFVIQPGGVRIVSFSSADLPFTIAIVLLLIRWSIRFPVALGGDEGKSLRTFFGHSRFSLDEWSAAVWILIGVIGSLGMNAFFHSTLFRVSILQSLRVPSRWTIVVHAGLAVWSALGVSALLERKVRWRRHAAAGLLVLLSLADVWTAIRWEDVVDDPLPVYRWMAANRTQLGPTLELPLAGAEFEYLLGSTAHHVPLVNGLSSFEPPGYSVLRERYAATALDDEFLALIEKSGCQYLVVHIDLLHERTGAVLKWLEGELARGTLEFVRRFDDGRRGDYVFAVPRNGPRWTQRRGRSDEDLTRLLAGKETYSAATIHWVDSPTIREEVSHLLIRRADTTHGPLTVSGWALSPAGIRSVRVCIADGRWCFATQPIARDDVLRNMPWYLNCPRPGFVVRIPRRPKGVRRETDFYLKITDGQGQVTRTSDYDLHWD